MIITTSKLAATSNSSPKIDFTLQDVGIFVGIVASLIIVSRATVNILSKINKISFTVDGIQETLKLHATNAEKIKDLDKRFDIHMQDYVNYKDANLLRYNGLHELIDHKWDRSEEEFKALEGNIKELQHFLQKRDEFKIRE